jgi:hypothetical protein
VRSSGSALLALLVVLLAGCESSKHPAPNPTSAATRRCATIVASTLGGVGERIYREAAGGRVLEQAVHRLRSSRALETAISSDDRAATRTALHALLLGQIVAVEILRGGHVIAAANAGAGPAIAPVSGSIPGTDASFVLSTQAAHSYAQVAQQVTGAQILLDTPSARVAGTIGDPSQAGAPRDGPLRLTGRSYQVASVSGRAYPAGPLHISLLVPSAGLACSASASQARVETLGHVGERIYKEESSSRYVLATLRHMEANTDFQRSVASRDTAATRAAIIAFFAAHIHVVRVHVDVSEPGGAQRYFYDLGGPYVLAPVRGALRSGGRVVGHFSFAIQDDAGYLKLARQFTGAQVLMRAGGRQVMGTLSPGPARVPDRGQVAYRGRTYDAYSFSGVAFPSGPLRISLLLDRRSLEG